jgi:hypothetical protein
MAAVGARGTGASCTLSAPLLTRLRASSSLCWATCAARTHCDLRAGASLPRTRDEESGLRESFALHGTGKGLAGALAIRGGGTEQGSALRSTTLIGGLGALRDDLRWLWGRCAVAGDRLVSEARLARSYLPLYGITSEEENSWAALALLWRRTMPRRLLEDDYASEKRHSSK